MRIVSIAASVVGLLLLVLMVPAHVSAACLGSPPSLTAQTWDDIPACHTLATNGTTITVTAGSYTVTTTFSITKYVKIIASGTVTITDNSTGGDPDAGGGPSLVTITESTAGNTRVQGFTFIQGTGVHQGIAGIIKIVAATGGQPVLAFGNRFTLDSLGNSFVWDSNRGVIADNDFTARPQGAQCFDTASAIRHKPGASFATSWSTPATWGSADTTGTGNLYFENNRLNFMGEGIDADDNARIVIRYNIMRDSAIILHGIETSPVYGPRYAEIYNNNFIWDTTPQPACSPPTFWAQPTLGFAVRGGTIVAHHNAIPNPSDGLWGQKRAVNFLAWQIRRAGGGFTCWSTTTAPGAGYPFPHQPGWGYITGATVLNGSNCPGCPVHQDSEPIYLWANTGDGNYDSPSIGDFEPNECGASAPLAAEYLVAGRDYFTNTVKPGYTEYTYPHPLTLDQPSAPSSISVAQQLAPSPAFAPVPASGLIMSSSASVTAVNTASEVSMFQFLIGPGLTATSSSQGAVVSPTYTGASASGMTTPVLWTTPAPLHFRAIGLLAGGAGTSLAIGVNLNDGIAPPSSGGGTATVNLNNSIIGAISGPGTMARLDVYVVPLATRTAPPNSANNAFLAARFAYVNVGGSETVVNSSVVAGVNFASPTRLNVLARWSAADSGSSLTFFNRMLKVVE